MFTQLQNQTAIIVELHKLKVRNKNMYGCSQPSFSHFYWMEACSQIVDKLMGHPVFEKHLHDCGYRNPSKKSLNNHIEKVHRKEKLKICPLCDIEAITDLICSFCLDFSTPKISQDDILNRHWVENIKSWGKLFCKIR